MNLLEAKSLAIELMDKHNLLDLGWHFSFDNSKRRFGVCKHRIKAIGLSAPLTELNDISQVKDTILHEIAHALVGANEGHNWVWKQKAIEIGCNGERCYSRIDVEMPKGNYQAICPNCKHIHNKYKAPRKTVRQSCGVCSNGKFSVDKLLVWEKIKK